MVMVPPIKVETMASINTPGIDHCDPEEGDIPLPEPEASLRPL
jgi:hypothetical protein